MAKSVDMMTGSEIKKAYDNAFEASLKNSRALCNAGFGHVRGSEMATADHPLARECDTIGRTFNAIVAEMDARKRYHGGTQRIITKGFAA